MNYVSFIIIALLMASGLVRADSITGAGARAAALSERGDFKGADVILAAALTNQLPAVERKDLELQRDLLKRVRQDYTLTKEQLFENLMGSVKGLTRLEFDQWVTEGRFDGKIIDGATYFVVASVPNLFYRYPELVARRLSPEDTVKEQRGRLELAQAIKKAALEQKTPYVLPHHFHCVMTLKANENAAPAGEIIRAWLPIPRKYPFQKDYKLTFSAPSPTRVSPEDSPIRSVYMEEKVVKDQPTVFKFAYNYTTYGVHFELNPKNVRPADLTNPELKKFTSEAPHVVFTDKIKSLVHDLAGNETNPMLQAKAFYDWIGNNVKYSYAREYSTLTNISDYCFANRYGDCGQAAMLFITMCRAKGIPARWQSGWDTWPSDTSNHDWTEIYLTPYGWIPVDPWAGIFSARYCTTLKPEERQELHDFYFGGLDYYRMAANSDHSQPLTPPKTAMRSDDVDFQRGELEWGNTNIYFDNFSYDLKVKEL